MTFRKRGFGLLVIMLVLALIMSACGGDDENGEDDNDNKEQATPLPATGDETPAPSAETPEPDQTEESSSAEQNTASEVTTQLTSAPVEVSSAEDTDGEDEPVARPEFTQEITDATGTLLVWTAPAFAPGQHTADQPGEIAYLDRDGNFTYLLPVPQQASTVAGCGDALSPDSQYYMLFMGLDNQQGGTLYLITNAGVPQVFAENVQFLTCRGGNGTLQYAPDNSYVGYIAYEPGSGEAGSDFAIGEMRLETLPAGDEVETFRNTVSFDVSENGVAFVQFFTNNRDEADEVAISWWDGDSDSEIATLNAQEDCRFVSAFVEVGAGNEVWTVLGERCPDGLTWQLYRTSADLNNALQVYSRQSAGAMVPYAQVNNLLFSPDGQTLLYTVPDGLEANSASLNAVSVADLSSPRELVSRGMVLPRYAAVENAVPQVSPDGRWLAMVVKDPAEPVKLVIYELSNLETDPYTIETGSGDTIPWFTFAPNSESRFYIAGSPNGGDNSISRFNLLDGSDERIERGTFTGWAVLSPDGSEIALLEWIEVPDGVRPANVDFYTDLRLINLSEEDINTVLEGATINGDQLENLRFVQPLAWLSR